MFYACEMVNYFFLFKTNAFNVSCFPLDVFGSERCCLSTHVLETSKMATQAAAALLDELMGRTRNVLPNERNQRLHWDSIEVKYIHFD